MNQQLPYFWQRSLLHSKGYGQNKFNHTDPSLFDQHNGHGGAGELEAQF